MNAAVDCKYFTLGRDVVCQMPNCLRMIISCKNSGGLGWSMEGLPIDSGLSMLKVQIRAELALE
jgi:hypothetical protein